MSELEFHYRCPACKQVGHEDEWEVGGADLDYQFCPICSREVMPINLYLESLGCEQEGLVNHEGPFKAEAELSAAIEEIYLPRAAEQEAAYKRRTQRQLFQEKPA